MARPKDPQLERLWRRRLARHSTSGLSIAEFCSRERSPLPRSTTGGGGSPLRQPRSPESAPVRPAPPRRHPTRWAPVAPRRRRARVAAPGPAPLRLPARARMARTRGRRDRRPRGRGGEPVIMLPPTVRVFLCTRPTDMRKSFDGLSGLVQECFGQDLLSRPSLPLRQPPQGSPQDPLLRSRRPGHLVQAARGRDASRCPPPAGADGIELKPAQLAMILSGIDLKQCAAAQAVPRTPADPGKP